MNIATFHAYAGFSPSYEFGSRVMRGHAARLHGRIAVSARGPPLHRPLLPGRLQGHPQRRRHRRASQRAVPLARWQDGTPNVLFVGRHEPRKGLLDLLKAYRILRRTGCDGRLLVVGSGPQEREARRYVADPRGSSGVEFLGRVSDAEKAQLFRTADVFVSPATGGESFGIVLLEAMAAGAPIVALRHPRLQGRRPARSRGACSSRRTSPRSWPTAIARLLDDPELRAAMGAAGPAPRRGVQLAAGDGQGRGLLRLRHPPAGRQRLAARRLPRADPSGAAAPREASAPRIAAHRRVRRYSPAAPPRPTPRPSAAPRSTSSRSVVALGEREPPDPGRVGDDQARSRPAPTAEHQRHRREAGGSATFAGHRADRELERVQVGRQDALVGVDDGRRQRQRR